jgi:arylsulfatase
MDISATILDAAGVDHPGKSYKGRKVEPLLGRSIMKVLNGKSDFVYENDTAVSWEMLGFRAVRKGDFKLVWLPLPFGNHNWQLRKEMIGIWKQYSKDVGVVLPPGGAMRIDMNLPITE